MLIWDNLNVHLDARMRTWIADRDWLTVHQLPSCAPDLNPVEGIWSLLRRGWLSNVAFTSPDHWSRRSGAACARSNTAVTSSADASPEPAYPSPRRLHEFRLSSARARVLDHVQLVTSCTAVAVATLGRAHVDYSSWPHLNPILLDTAIDITAPSTSRPLEGELGINSLDSTEPGMQ